MKKTTALLAGFLCLAIVLQAQKKQPKFLAELTAGPSIPIGKFASTSNANNKASGYAKPGWGGQLSLGYYLNRSFGLLLSTGYTTHQQDQQARKDVLKSRGNTVVRIDSENWKALNVMAGGFFITPLTSGSKLRLFTKLTAGVCETGIPREQWFGYSNTGRPAYYYDEKITMCWAFCYQGSVGLQYKLNQKWYVLLDASYFNAIPKQEVTYYVSSRPVAQVGPTGRYVTEVNKYELSTINALVGIGINL